MVHKLRILSSRGDTVLEFDTDIDTPEARAAVREAERVFEEKRALGATAFRVEPEKPAQRIDAFDRTAEQIIIVPKVAGG